MNLGIHKINETATIPTFGTNESACFDLYANLPSNSEVVTYSKFGVKMFNYVYSDKKLRIPENSTAIIPTGLIFDIPEGYALGVYSRSSVAIKRGLHLANSVGVIDSDYTNELFIALYNSRDTLNTVKHGERIAQVWLKKLEPRPDFTILSDPPEQRGNRIGGIGSTGK